MDEEDVKQGAEMFLAGKQHEKRSKVYRLLSLGFWLVALAIMLFWQQYSIAILGFAITMIYTALGGKHAFKHHHLMTELWKFQMERLPVEIQLAYKLYDNYTDLTAVQIGKMAGKLREEAKNERV